MFAIVTQAVIARTSEIGIRMALGATSGLVTRLILLECLLLVAGGVVLGNALAVLAAALLPTRRATHIDPAISLRHE